MSDVKFTVANEAPASNGAITTPATGTWAANTNSFKVGVWYTDAETEEDNIGIAYGTIAAWNGIVVAGNDTVIIPVTIDTTRAFHIVVYYQTAATYVMTNAGMRIDDAEITLTQTAATTWTISIDSGATSANFTFTALATLELSPPAPIGVEYRQGYGRDYQGNLIKEDFVDDRIIESVTIIANAYLSTDTTGLKTLQRWLKDQVYLKVEDTNPDTESYFDEVYGVIGSLNQYSSRIVSEDLTIFIPVDAESVT